MRKSLIARVLTVATAAMAFAMAPLSGVALAADGGNDTNGATAFGTRNGNTAITGVAGGIGNTCGTPLLYGGLLCAVPLPEGGRRAGLL